MSFQRRSRHSKRNMSRLIYKTGVEWRTVLTLWKNSSKGQVSYMRMIYCIEAIHEIRSKVILYKEFLKLLYEDEPNAI